MATLSDTNLGTSQDPGLHAFKAEIEKVRGGLDEQQIIRDRIESLEGKKTGGMYAIFIGGALIAASLASVRGQTLLIQCAVGGIILLAGLIPFLYCGRQIRLLRAKLVGASES